MAKLTDDELLRAVDGLPGWSVDDGQLVREFTLPSFPDAIAFVNRVADRAEAADHHPDLDIRYTKVRAALATHSEGGITKKDVALAGEIDACAAPS